MRDMDQFKKRVLVVAAISFLSLAGLTACGGGNSTSTPHVFSLGCLKISVNIIEKQTQFEQATFL